MWVRAWSKSDGCRPCLAKTGTDLDEPSHIWVCGRNGSQKFGRNRATLGLQVVPSWPEIRRSRRPASAQICTLWPDSGESRPASPDSTCAPRWPQRRKRGRAIENRTAAPTCCDPTLPPVTASATRSQMDRSSPLGTATRVGGRLKTSRRGVMRRFGGAGAATTLGGRSEALRRTSRALRRTCLRVCGCG